MKKIYIATVYMESNENIIYENKTPQQLKLICSSFNDNFEGFWLEEFGSEDASRRCGYIWGVFGALHGEEGVVTRASGATEISETATPSGRW